MLILQIPPRIIKIHGLLRFPCEALVEADLFPRELFGLEKLSGRLPLGGSGHQVQLRADPVDGGILLEVSGRLDPLQFEATLSGMKVTVANGHLRASWTCADEEHLRGSILTLDLVVPALLAATVPSPVRIGELTGTVGDAGLTFEVKATTTRAMYSVTGTGLATSMAARLAAFDAALQQPNNVILTSAHRYLLQARRLGYASNHNTEFIAERLLNLYKAIEILFGRSTDNIRRELKSIASQDLIEGIFVPLVYVRDELDVGHPAIQTLDPADWERLRSFAEQAEDGVTWLLAAITEAVAAGKFSLRSLKHNTNKSKLLQQLAARPSINVQAYGKRQP